MKSRAGGVEDRLNEIVEKVMYREGKSSNEIATDMFKFFEKAVKKSNYWDKPEDLKEKIILIGKNIIEKDKMNFVVRNCVVRMLKLIKEASKEEETQLMSLKSLAEKTQD
jgi:translation initiation factor 2B subunit (eIF-2B alpha/beta/delta family)